MSNFTKWLPKDILLSLFSMLDFHTLCIVSAVCTEWYQTAHEPKLWKHLYETKWNESPLPSTQQQSLNSDNFSFKILFLQRLFAEHDIKKLCTLQNTSRLLGYMFDEGIETIDMQKDYVLIKTTKSIVKINYHSIRHYPLKIKAKKLKPTVSVLSNDKDKVCIGFSNGIIKTFDENMKSMKTIRAHTRPILCMIIHERNVYTGGDGVKVHDIDSGNLIQKFHHCYAGVVTHIALQQTASLGLIMATVHSDRSVRIWNCASGTMERVLTCPNIVPIKLIEFSGHILNALMKDDSVVVWDTRLAHPIPVYRSLHSSNHKMKVMKSIAKHSKPDRFLQENQQKQNYSSSESLSSLSSSSVSSSISYSSISKTQFSHTSHSYSRIPFNSLLATNGMWQITVREAFGWRKLPGDIELDVFRQKKISSNIQVQSSDRWLIEKIETALCELGINSVRNTSEEIINLMDNADEGTTDVILDLILFHGIQTITLSYAYAKVISLIESIKKSIQVQEKAKNLMFSNEWLETMSSLSGISNFLLGLGAAWFFGQLFQQGVVNLLDLRSLATSILQHLQNNISDNNFTVEKQKIAEYYTQLFVMLVFSSNESQLISTKTQSEFMFMNVLDSDHISSYTKIVAQQCVNFCVAAEKNNENNLEKQINSNINFDIILALFQKSTKKFHSLIQDSIQTLSKEKEIKLNKETVSFIIGRKGQTLNQIMQRSGATIYIQEKKGGSSFPTIHFKGDAHSVNIGMALINYLQCRYFEHHSSSVTSDVPLLPHRRYISLDIPQGMFAYFIEYHREFDTRFYGRDKWILSTKKPSESQMNIVSQQCQNYSHQLANNIDKSKNNPLEKNISPFPIVVDSLPNINDCMGFFEAVNQYHSFPTRILLRFGKLFFYNLSKDISKSFVSPSLLKLQMENGDVGKSAFDNTLGEEEAALLLSHLRTTMAIDNKPSKRVKVQVVDTQEKNDINAVFDVQSNEELIPLRKTRNDIHLFQGYWLHGNEYRDMMLDIVANPHIPKEEVDSELEEFLSLIKLQDQKPMRVFIPDSSRFLVESIKFANAAEFSISENLLLKISYIVEQTRGFTKTKWEAQIRFSHLRDIKRINACTKYERRKMIDQIMTYTNDMINNGREICTFATPSVRVSPKSN